MSKSVTEEHEEIYHYTNAIGLQGIVSSQSLWATQISFLNDANEQMSFFDRRAPALFDSAIRAASKSLMVKPKSKKVIERAGGYEKWVKDETQIFLAALREATLAFNDPYVVSFCTAKDKNIIQDGLLSQWRAYGPDGGYAIVFDTQKLEEIFKKESATYAYQFSSWGDVNYYHEAQNQEAALEEIREYEDVVKKSIFEFFTTNEKDKLDPIYDKISYLSCIYKHWGFHEERELRMVLIRTHKTVLEKERKLGENSRPQKTVKYIQRNGCLVPYICLFDFGDMANSGPTGLPIKRVIVGPHPDKEKRKKSVESLLNQYEIDAEVSMSTIPYIGK